MPSYTFRFLIGNVKLSEKHNMNTKGYFLTNLASAYEDGIARAEEIAKNTKKAGEVIGPIVRLVSVDQI